MSAYTILENAFKETDYSERKKIKNKVGNMLHELDILFNDLAYMKPPLARETFAFLLRNEMLKRIDSLKIKRIIIKTCLKSICVAKYREVVRGVKEETKMSRNQYRNLRHKLMAKPTDGVEMAHHKFNELRDKLMSKPEAEEYARQVKEKLDAEIEKENLYYESFSIWCPRCFTWSLNDANYCHKCGRNIRGNNSKDLFEDAIQAYAQSLIIATKSMFSKEDK